MKYHYTKSINLSDNLEIDENLFNEVIQEAKEHISKTENIDLIEDFQKIREEKDVMYDDKIGEFLEFKVTRGNQQVCFLSGFLSNDNQLIEVFSHP